jgi:hypothetical protein
VDNSQSCDDQLDLAGDANAAARAIGLCQTAGENDTKWGVIAAAYTNGFGQETPPNALQHGILTQFGNVIRPKEGKSLVVLSSGHAREHDGALIDGGLDNSVFKGGQPMDGAPEMGPSPCKAPPGFPKETPGCGTPSTTVRDLANLRIKVRVPANAKGFLFNFDFYSGEWPDYVCTAFNDAFIAYVTSGAGTGNVAFDAMGNSVSVNVGFFDRCTPNVQTGCNGMPAVLKTATCPGGSMELMGTGFGEPPVGNCADSTLPFPTPGGATGWLTTRAPLVSGEVATIEFMIWDTGDQRYDSSALVDGFTWIEGAAPTPQTLR